MPDSCHVCGPVKHESPTVLCAPCALQQWRSDLARRRLEALVPLADAIRRLDVVNEFVSRPLVYIPPLVGR